MTSSPVYPSGATGTATDPLGIESILDELRASAGEQAEPAGGAAPHLVNNANNCGKSGKALVTSDSDTRAIEAKEKVRETAAKRTGRWTARGILWDMSQLERVQKCGRVCVAPGGNVEVFKDGSVVGFGGLATCGSVWACPVCSAKIQAVRREEVVGAVRGAVELGDIAFGTMTLRHKKGQALADLWDTLAYCFGRVRQDKGVRRLRDEMGFYGYVRTVEVTHGGNGWHPHIHTLNLFDREVTPEQLEALANAEFRAWKAAAVSKGLGEPMRERYELRKVYNATDALGHYFAKSVYEPDTGRPAVLPTKEALKAIAVRDAGGITATKMGYEMSGSATKKGRKGSRTPWEILQGFEATGDLDDLDLWHEYEKASKGRRSMVWSRGLKAMFEVEEIADEDIVEEEYDGDEKEEDPVLFLVTDWSPIARNARLGGELLAAVELGGREGGLRFCLRHGIPTALPPGHGGVADEDEDEDSDHIMRDFTTV